MITANVLYSESILISTHPRITVEPDKRDGMPCIRGMRITVNDVLGWLAHGMTEAEILDEHHLDPGPAEGLEAFRLIYEQRRIDNSVDGDKTCS